MLSLAVLVDGHPEATLLPFARREDYGAELQPGLFIQILICPERLDDVDA